MTVIFLPTFAQLPWHTQYTGLSIRKLPHWKLFNQPMLTEGVSIRNRWCDWTHYLSEFHSNCNKLPLFMTLIDLRNAFGSIHHSLLQDMLAIVNLPASITRYISSLYAHLSAYILTRQRKTPSFKISRGVFQGDTLSPILFFQPIVDFINDLPYENYKLKLSIDNSQGIPPINSHIYVEWQEENSSEPAGWYHCTIIEYHHDSTVTLKYQDGATDFRSVKWSFAKKNGKIYLPIELSCIFAQTGS